jgi:anti-anti-sigma factor
MTTSTDRSPRSQPWAAGSVQVAPATHEFTVIRLAGEHDTSTAAALGDAFAQALTTDSPEVLLDLSEVTFIDASTINAMIGLQNGLDEASRTLTLHRPAPCVIRLLAICGQTVAPLGSNRMT